MKLILIENKIYKVPKKVFEALKKFQDGNHWKDAQDLDEYCDAIQQGGVYGVRYLGEIEFDKSNRGF